MNQSTSSKKVVSWHDIMAGALLYEFYEGLEYEVPDVGRVWIDRKSLEALAILGGNPQCHLHCHPNFGRDVPVCVLVWFE